MDEADQLDLKQLLASNCLMCALTDIEPLSHVDFDLMLQLIAAGFVGGDATVQPRGYTGSP